VEPYAVIEDDAEVGDGTELRTHVVIKRFTTIGKGNAVHEAAILGGEPQDVGFAGAETRLRIGDGNRIREGVTIHRATRPGGETVVGSGCFLMAYAHVAHECVIGDGAVLANNVALAGHVDVGPQAFLSGGVVVHQFCRVGRLSMLGGNSKIVQDCLPFVITDGVPGRARGRRSGRPAPRPQGGLSPPSPFITPPRSGPRAHGRPRRSVGGRDDRVRAGLEAGVPPGPARRRDGHLTRRTRR